MKKFNILVVGIIIGIILTIIVFNSLYTYVPAGNTTVELTDDEYNQVESLQFDTVSFSPKYIEEMQSITITNGKTSYFLYYTDEDCNMFSLEVEMTESVYNTVLDMWKLSIQSQCKTDKQQYYINSLNDMLHKHQFIIINNNNKPRLEYENI